jgi:hypothetical protein
MNKLISFVAVNLVPFSLLAQTVNDVPIKDIDVEYVQIVGTAKFFSTKVIILVLNQNILWCLLRALI